MIYSLQAYRGFAAILVLLYHTNAIIPKYYESVDQIQFFNFGFAGVHFFFVLSGFIVFHVHKADIGNFLSAKKYIVKRIIRIYPLYWIVTLSLLPFWIIVPTFGQHYHHDIWSLIKSLLLFPQEHNPHLSVAWSLCYEVLFYFIFISLLVSKKIGSFTIAAWQLLIVVLIFIRLPIELPMSFIFDSINLLFGFGILAAISSKNLPDKLKPWAFSIGNLLFVSIGIRYSYFVPNEHYTLAPNLLFGAASFLIVVSCRSTGLEKLFKENKFFAIVGDASYSIYLVHFPALSLLCKIFKMTNAENLSLFSYLIFPTLAFIAFCLGVAFHKLVEVPVLNILRDKYS